MKDPESKTVLWNNLVTLMEDQWGKVNLNRLARDAEISPASATRLKAQETSVGVEIVDRLAKVFKVKPWQLLAPDMGAPVPPPPPTYSTYAVDVAEWMDALETNEQRLMASSVIYQMLVKKRWPVFPDEVARPETTEPAETPKYTQPRSR